MYLQRVFEEAVGIDVVAVFDIYFAYGLISIGYHEFFAEFFVDFNGFNQILERFFVNPLFLKNLAHVGI